MAYLLVFIHLKLPFKQLFIFYLLYNSWLSFSPIIQCFIILLLFSLITSSLVCQGKVVRYYTSQLMETTRNEVQCPFEIHKFFIAVIFSSDTVAYRFLSLLSCSSFWFICLLLGAKHKQEGIDKVSHSVICFLLLDTLITSILQDLLFARWCPWGSLLLHGLLCTLKTLTGKFGDLILFS